LTEKLRKSQDATQYKNAAFIELKEWMNDFDAIAQSHYLTKLNYLKHSLYL